jgi:cholesterol transport system auxiliary component
MAIDVFAPVRIGRAASKGVALASALAALISLPGCSSPRETFDLSPSPPASHVAGVVIAVDEPNAPAVLDGDRFLLRDENGALSYLADAQWSDRLPRLVQMRLIERLERRGLRAVRAGEAAALRLSTELRRFEIDTPRGTAIVEITARLTRDKGGATVAEATFSGEAPAPHTIGVEAVHAYEAALDMAADRLAAWARSRR